MSPTRNPDPPPSGEQCRLLCQLMKRAFLEFRMIGWQGGSPERVVELADTFHNLPDLMYRQTGWDRRLFRLGLEGYERKYGSVAIRSLGYVAQFDGIFGSEPNQDRSAGG